MFGIINCDALQGSVCVSSLGVGKGCLRSEILINQYCSFLHSRLSCYEVQMNVSAVYYIQCSFGYQSSEGDWHHVVVSYRGKTAAVYIDNVKTSLGALSGMQI